MAQKQPEVRELPVSDLSGFKVEEVIWKCRQVGMLDRASHLKPTHPHWESQPVRNEVVGEVPTSLKSSSL